LASSMGVHALGNGKFCFCGKRPIHYINLARVICKPLSIYVRPETLVERYLLRFQQLRITLPSPRLPIPPGAKMAKYFPLRGTANANYPHVVARPSTKPLQNRGVSR
jgi:hypothetical protein